MNSSLINFHKLFNGIRKIELNRPKQLNVLNGEMFTALTHHIQKWNEDPESRLIVFDSVAPKVFSAGGDIKEAGMNIQHSHDKFINHLQLEYKLCEFLYRLKVPSLAIWDGIVMGAGAGITMGCTYRIATPNTKVLTYISLYMLSI